MDKSKIIELREKTGSGLRECEEALVIFNGNTNQAFEYLRMIGIAVCRRKVDGTNWKKKDYIDYVKNNIK